MVFHDYFITDKQITVISSENMLLIIQKAIPVIEGGSMYQTVLANIQDYQLQQLAVMTIYCCTSPSQHPETTLCLELE